MTKLLLILLILVSGHLTRNAIPSLRKSAIRANGQQLTLTSAMSGLGIYLPALFILFLIFDNPCFDEQSCVKISNNPPENHESPRNISIFAAYITFFIALTLQVTNKTITWFNEYMLDESEFRDKISKKTKDCFGEKVSDFLLNIINYLHWLSYDYTTRSAKKIIEGDHAESLYLESMLERKNGLCMFVLDNKKVIIGNVAGMPDLSVAKAESNVKVLPYFTGYLCENQLQLHITTDYTFHIEEQINGTAHQSYSFDVVIPSKNIKYLREFDRNYFNESFIDKRCHCGNGLYIVESKKEKNSSTPFSGYRHRKIGT